ncbi:putative glycerophosphoryl diester phosphodiesterase precursor (GlpQ) [Mycolicibacterium phlei]|uniref:glycerophosphodiester phosphodiesterase family protein n=1 Tax=Mycobacteroides chelonae TaxID=1774 RepID=UPI000618CDDA|nr:glycerophosphodiester phosphodiesterase family protein [Mycobacteroides chelonae]VEG14682.1 putative glycerophosphoryl diester phosphodiesterase precursor (GlpQ) [Mycolicibacterium phlei]AKC37694.1 glycerophosphodiester phosphodiesterase [Mycobacteroides chelonae]ANA96774.1 glycerophosphodiester phosphodiesterase [Mycobacteroides chelonae CCUG 47445]OLT81118.1 glycerophosphodiester phosphodiesterase [Mycobacteroides chelonae]ORV17150.1 glycerophosphodiester phosphodiesterase [Mycobacteroide
MKRLAAVLAVTLALTSCGDKDAASFDLQAHRGGRGETTEESLRAFAKALELGVSTLELDIVISKDHKPMVWHDPVIDSAKCSDTVPVTPGDPQFPYVGKLVKDLTSDQLRSLDCGKLLKDFPQAEVVKNDRIALLPEVFALADSYHADVRYNIETKVEAAEPQKSAEPQVFVDVILGAIRSAGKVDKVEIQSFDWRTLPMTKRAEPAIPLVALWDETTWYPGSPWLGGVDPAVVKDPIDGAKQIGATILSPGYTVPYGGKVGDPGFTLVADKKFIEKAHALGLKVIPWTINDAETMKAQIDAGADGIISDYPTTLRKALAEKGLALPPAYHR